MLHFDTPQNLKELVAKPGVTVFLIYNRSYKSQQGNILHLAVNLTHPKHWQKKLAASFNLEGLKSRQDSV